MDFAMVAYLDNRKVWVMRRSISLMY